MLFPALLPSSWNCCPLYWFSHQTPKTAVNLFPTLFTRVIVSTSTFFCAVESVRSVLYHARQPTNETNFQRLKFNLSPGKILAAAAWHFPTQPRQRFSARVRNENSSARTKWISSFEARHVRSALCWCNATEQMFKLAGKCTQYLPVHRYEEKIGRGGFVYVWDKRGRSSHRLICDAECAGLVRVSSVSFMVPMLLLLLNFIVHFDILK